MATRGFEFAYMLDGSNATPVIRDITLGTTTAAKVGDLYCVQSDGYADEVTASATVVSHILQESASSPTAGTTKVKAAIITNSQVWRCSSDASTAATAIAGYHGTMDVTDQNTMDADDITNGKISLLDKSDTDDAGNLIFYVVFNSTRLQVV